MLRADPIFFRSLTRGKGVKRTAFSIENTDEAPFQGALVALRQCPEWLHLERVLPSGETQQLAFGPPAQVPEQDKKRHPGWLVVPPRRRVQLVASVNTDHRYFPRAQGELPRGERALRNESAVVEVELSGGERLEVPVAIAEVVLERDEFDGAFALDFGTTNSCYAWKRRRGGPEGLERPPACSSEIPSIIYFKDLRVRESPKALIGHKARLAILANPARVYSAVEGVKRLLGSDQAITVLDARGRSATYRPQEVASFIVRQILDQAEQELLEGRRIRRVIATYPTLFSPRHRRALQDAILMALRLGDPQLVPDELLEPGERSADVQARRDELVQLRLDEANAATFRYITGPLLEACLRFNREQVADVVSFDLGGGTTDISYLRVDVRRELAERRTKIEARLLGVSGEGAFGGDNVSLELVRLLRAKLAVEAARALAQSAQAQASSQKATEGLDIFDRILQSGGLSGGVEGGSPWGAGAAQEEGEDEEFQPPPLDKRVAAARLIAANADVILRAAAEGHLEHPLVVEGKDAFVEHLRDLLRAQAHELGRPFQPQDADRIDEAIERLMPTRFARYADSDPTLERRAKVLFMDLWREANDRLKPLLVARTNGELDAEAAEKATATVQEPLDRLARYVGVDPKVWNDKVSISLAELERMIEPRVRRTVQKARDLYLLAADEDGPAGAEEAEEEAPLISTSVRRRPAAKRRARPRLTILLTGNSSILPLVRRTFAEVFKGVDHELVWDERTRKTSVVQGAVEESLLRLEFGDEGGGIHYASFDFLDRLPFSIGLYSRFVGFKPIFGRGAREGDVTLVDSRENELVKRGIEELSLYADYHDGAPVRYLGSFELKRGGRPATSEELEVFPTPEQDARGRPVFQLLFRLRRDWEVELVNPEDELVHRLVVDPVQVDPREDPFAGVM